MAIDLKTTTLNSLPKELLEKIGEHLSEIEFQAWVQTSFFNSPGLEEILTKRKVVWEQACILESVRLLFFSTPLLKAQMPKSAQRFLDLPIWHRPFSLLKELNGIIKQKIETEKSIELNKVDRDELIKILDIFIRAGEVKVIEALTRCPNFHQLPLSSLEEAIEHAAWFGDVKLIEILKPVLLKKYEQSSMPPALLEKIVVISLSNGHENILELCSLENLSQEGLEKALFAAVKNGHENIINLFDLESIPLEWLEQIFIGAVENGHAHILDLFEEESLPIEWVEKAFAAAASNEHVHIINRPCFQSLSLHPPERRDILLRSIGQGNVKIGEALLQFPEVDKISSLREALLRAKNNGHETAVKVFIKYPCFGFSSYEEFLDWMEARKRRSLMNDSEDDLILEDDEEVSDKEPDKILPCLEELEKMVQSPEFKNISLEDLTSVFETSAQQSYIGVLESLIHHPCFDKVRDGPLYDALSDSLKEKRREVVQLFSKYERFHPLADSFLINNLPSPSSLRELLVSPFSPYISSQLLERVFWNSNRNDYRDEMDKDVAEVITQFPQFSTLSSWFLELCFYNEIHQEYCYQSKGWPLIVKAIIHSKSFNKISSSFLERAFKTAIDATCLCKVEESSLYVELVESFINCYRFHEIGIEALEYSLHLAFSNGLVSIVEKLIQNKRFVELSSCALGNAVVSMAKGPPYRKENPLEILKLIFHHKICRHGVDHPLFIPSKSLEEALRVLERKAQAEKVPHKTDAAYKKSMEAKGYTYYPYQAIADVIIKARGHLISEEIKS